MGPAVPPPPQSAGELRVFRRYRGRGTIAEATGARQDGTPNAGGPKALEEQREALESAVAAEARERERIDAEIARREADGTLEADLKRYEAEARRADPFWGRKPERLRREAVMAAVTAGVEVGLAY